MDSVRSQSSLPRRPDLSSSADLRACMLKQVMAQPAVRRHGLSGWLSALASLARRMLWRGRAGDEHRCSWRVTFLRCARVHVLDCRAPLALCGSAGESQEKVYAPCSMRRCMRGASRWALRAVSCYPAGRFFGIVMIVIVYISVHVDPAQREGRVVTRRAAHSRASRARTDAIVDFRQPFCACDIKVVSAHTVHCRG